MYIYGFDVFGLYQTAQIILYEKVCTGGITSPPVYTYFISMEAYTFPRLYNCVRKYIIGKVWHYHNKFNINMYA